MSVNLHTAVGLFALFSVALTAGLFYAWEVSVIPGTKKISDRSYVEAMQSINRAILNPWFFVMFLGSVLSLPALSYLQYTVAVDGRFWLITAATSIYLVGMLGVTMFGNVPLNEALDKVEITILAQDELDQTRQTYEKRWNRLNKVRTVAALAAFALLLFAKFT